MCVCIMLTRLCHFDIHESNRSLNYSKPCFKE